MGNREAFLLDATASIGSAQIKFDSRESYRHPLLRRSRPRARFLPRLSRIFFLHPATPLSRHRRFEGCWRRLCQTDGGVYQCQNGSGLGLHIWLYCKTSTTFNLNRFYCWLVKRRRRKPIGADYTGDIYRPPGNAAHIGLSVPSLRLQMIYRSKQTKLLQQRFLDWDCILVRNTKNLFEVVSSWLSMIFQAPWKVIW